MLWHAGKSAHGHVLISDAEMLLKEIKAVEAGIALRDINRALQCRRCASNDMSTRYVKPAPPRRQDNTGPGKERA